MKKIKFKGIKVSKPKRVLKGLLIVSCLSLVLVGLTGCEDAADSSDKTPKTEQNSSKNTQNRVKATNQMNFETAKDNFKNVCKLNYFEYRASSDTDNTYYTLSYYPKEDSSKTVQKGLESGSMDYEYREVIDTKASAEPYVIFTNNTYYIHRPPYNQYNLPPVKGEVTDKETIE